MPFVSASQTLRYGIDLPCLLLIWGVRVWGSSMFRFVRKRRRGRTGFVDKSFLNPVPRISSFKGACSPSPSHHLSQPTPISPTRRQQISLVSESEPAPPKLKIGGFARRLHVYFVSTRRKQVPQYKKRRALASSTTQAKPSFRFVPVMALHRRMFHRCVRISSSRRAWQAQRGLVSLGQK